MDPTTQREGFGGALNGGRGVGPTTVIRSAKDPVQIPNEARYTKLLQDTFVVAAVGDNCYVLEGMFHDIRTIPFGCTYDDWKHACAELLELSIQKAGDENE